MQSSHPLKQSGLGQLLALNTPQVPAAKSAQSAQSRDTAKSHFGDTLAGVGRELKAAETRPQPGASRRPLQADQPAPQTPPSQASRQDVQAGTNRNSPPDTVAAAGNDQPASGRQDTAADGDAPADFALPNQATLTTETVENIPTLPSPVTLAEDGLPAMAEGDIEPEAAVKPEIIGELEIDPEPTEPLIAMPQPGDAEAEIPEEAPVEGLVPVATDTDTAVDPLFANAVIAPAQVPAAQGTKTGDEVLLREQSLPKAAGPVTPTAILQSAQESTPADADASLDLMPELPGKSGFARLMEAQSSTHAAREAAASTNTATQTPIAAAQAARLVEPLQAARTFIPQPMVQVPVGQPQWSQAVGDRVLWLASQNLAAAELRLDPPDLGPMQVRISVQQDQVQVSFTSPHASVREALDQGATRLREMFNEQGLNLNMDVSDQTLSRRQADEEASGQGRSPDGEADDDEQLLAETPVGQVRLVDHYA